ncbi:hypothetical protein LTR70_005538 [Exophiala xenobiotica]|uniref:Microtubule associated protein n=1 Tax=Lithohypha guttulata TaxID=1690604 RepID=A0ABR0K9P2_9EURO|nr:hypothetical protein LTR24_005245 [Lithohypha guttulata]KAK5318054.1 hypothetical protein LTR70_005538 [Exophiala xenobiotica]
MTPPASYSPSNPRSKWDVHNPHSRLGQIWTTNIRKLYNPIGFHKGYNFPLFIIGVGGLMGFVLSRMFYFDFYGTFSRKAAPGEFYYYRGGHNRVGILLHLAGVLPGGFLACLQFVPIIRYKALLFHRLNGYAAIVLLLCGNAGAFMIARHSMGGDISLQLWVGVIGTMITIALVLAYVNIKRLQIDQHRAWMLRAWTWAASIVSLRLVLLAAMHVVTVYGYTFYAAIRCAEIHYMYQHVGVPDIANPTGQIYPQCAMSMALDPSTGIMVPTGESTNPATNTATFVSVVNLGPGPENAAAFVRTLFPMSGWLAIVIHALVVEIYLGLTPAESYRLRNVSYEKQLEKGLRRKGAFRDAGITGTTIGDAPEWWSIKAEDYSQEKADRAEHEKVEPVAKARSGNDVESGDINETL